MKRHFSCVVIALFVLTSVNAQNLQFGISGGVDASRMAVSGASGGPLKFKTELIGGISLENSLSSVVGIQVEVNYSAQGAGVVSEDGATIGSYQLDYLTIPVLVKLYGSPRLSFFAGPQIGILLNAKTKVSNSPDTDVKDSFKKTDTYAVFGAEYKFANGIFVNARYNVGMTNVIDDNTVPDQEIKNRYFSFRLGYAFKL